QRYVLLKSINSTPEKVYYVVSEVSEYQKFVPYCMESFVNKRDPIDDKPIEAGLRVGFRQYDEKFLCDVKCSKQDSQYKVVANSVSHNLFHLLYGEWTIKPHPQRRSSTQVELLLRFKFKSKLYDSVSSLFARSVTELVMKAF
ncbi:cyclase/dehydrase, partial [Zygosaccharomyces rouxii]